MEYVLCDLGLECCIYILVMMMYETEELLHLRLCC